MNKFSWDEKPQSFLDRLTKYKIMHYLMQVQNIFWKFHFYHILSVVLYWEGTYDQKG